MKRRLILLIAFMLIGLISIELYFRLQNKTNYAEMPYEIYYQENTNNPEKFLTEQNYIAYYFQNYDSNSYVLFANKKKMSIIDAYLKGYIFLGDILAKVNIIKKYNFTLEFNESLTQDLACKYQNNDIKIYYYKINDIKLINNQDKSNFLELIEENKIKIETIISYLEENDFKKEIVDNYIIYQKDHIVIIKNEDSIYFGNQDLNIKLIEKR